MANGKLQNKEGYLVKKVKSLFKGGWEKRFIRLENREFSYYMEKSNGELERKGILSFDIYQVTLELDF